MHGKFTSGTRAVQKWGGHCCALLRAEGTWKTTVYPAHTANGPVPDPTSFWCGSGLPGYTTSALTGVFVRSQRWAVRRGSAVLVMIETQQFQLVHLVDQRSCIADKHTREGEACGGLSWVATAGQSGILAFASSPSRWPRHLCWDVCYGDLRIKTDVQKFLPAVALSTDLCSVLAMGELSKWACLTLVLATSVLIVSRFG